MVNMQQMWPLIDGWAYRIPFRSIVRFDTVGGVLAPS